MLCIQSDTKVWKDASGNLWRGKPVLLFGLLVIKHNISRFGGVS